jgi:hypothetical protein
MIKNQKLVGNEKIEDGRSQVVTRRARDDRFDVVYKFVADETERAASEARQAWPRNRVETTHYLFHHGQTVLDRLGAARGRTTLHDKSFSHFAILDQVY